MIDTVISRTLPKRLRLGFMRPSPWMMLGGVERARESRSAALPPSCVFDQLRHRVLVPDRFHKFPDTLHELLKVGRTVGEGAFFAGVVP